jgi:hypothetical protein
MIQGARRLSEEGPEPAHEAEAVDASAEGIPDAEPIATPLPPTGRRWPGMAAGVVLLLLAFAWVAGLTATLAMQAPGPLAPLRLLAWIGLGAGPLALLGVLALLLVRHGRLDASDALLASAALRADARALEQTLARFDARVAHAREALATHGEALAGFGEATGVRLGQAAAELGGQADSFRRTAAALDEATATARADLGVLLADLPRAEAASAGLAERLREGGAEADNRARALADLLALLDERARTASEATGGAAARLGAQLERLDGGVSTVEQRLQDAAAALREEVDGALAVTAQALERVRDGVTEQSGTLVALSAQGRATLDAAGEEAARRLGQRLDLLNSRLNGFGQGVAQQDEQVALILSRMEGALSDTEGRLSGLARIGLDGADNIRAALAEVDGRFDGVARSFVTQERAVAALLDRVGQLRAAAEAGGVTLGETIPAALARVRLHADQSLQAIAQAGERGERLRDTAEAVAAELREADAALASQHRTLDEAGTKAGDRLQLITERAGALRALVAQTHGELRELVEHTDGSLADALRTAREAAAEAGEQARDALTAAIPRTAQRLGESAARALTAALTDAGHAELEAVEAKARQAVEAARDAAAQLTRQLVTIAETATAIDARISANQADTEAHDEASFARTAALLIEGLNSSAIDLNRLFEAEVSDDAWRAYLKGDRGVFTRRAVKLLDRSEAGTIGQRYEAEPEFHEQINRYIHDFEALLRRVMATHEGQGLATTLLSSDMGKLYVALAQAIERLRR